MERLRWSILVFATASCSGETEKIRLDGERVLPSSRVSPPPGEGTSATPVPDALATTEVADTEKSGATPAPSPAGVKAPSRSVYFIAPDGNDDIALNDGSPEKPFKSLANCLRFVQRNQTCFVKAGTYRAPALMFRKLPPSGNLPFRIEGESRAEVVFRGTEAIESSLWRKVEGTARTWVATLPEAWPKLPVGKQMLFWNDQPLWEARHPNTAYTLQPNRGVKERTVLQGTPTTLGTGKKEFEILSSLRLGSADALKGALMNIQAGAGIWTLTAEVTSSRTDGTVVSQLTVPPNSGNAYVPREKNPYFLWNSKALLDEPGEWYFDADTRQLYLVAPAEMDMASTALEWKVRDVCLSSGDNSFVSIKSLTFKGCRFASNIYGLSGNDVTGLTLDGVDFLWPFHDLDGRRTSAIGSGIILPGTGSTIRNSRIHGSSGNGIVLFTNNANESQEGSSAENNYLENVGYGAFESAGIAIYNGYGHSAKNNTVTLAGRHCIVYSPKYPAGVNGLPFANGYSPDWVSRIVISHNRLMHCLDQTPDGGYFYTWGNGGGAEIHHNLIHDSIPGGRKGGEYWSQGESASPGAGIYLDYHSKDFKVHHNIVFNSSMALFLNEGSEKSEISYNTLRAEPPSVSIPYKCLGDSVAVCTSIVVNQNADGHQEGYHRMTLEQDWRGTSIHHNLLLSDWSRDSHVLDAEQMRLLGNVAPDIPIPVQLMSATNLLLTSLSAQKEKLRSPENGDFRPLPNVCIDAGALSCQEAAPVLGSTLERLLPP